MLAGFDFRKPHGSYAELIVAPESHVAALPEGISFEAAAALPLVSLTALQASAACAYWEGQFSASAYSQSLFL